MNAPHQPPPDTIELGEVFRSLRREWRWIVFGLAFGVLGAVFLNAFGPLRYKATASLILRDRSEAGGGQFPLGGGALEGVTDLFSLPGQLGSQVDTEVEILQSRKLLEQISDSVGLQLQLRSPRGVRPDSVFSEIRLDPYLEKATYTFRREGGGFRVEGEGVDETVEPGGTLRVPGGALTLRIEGIPDRFRVRLMDRQDVVDRILRKELLSAEVIGGGFAQITFTARDPGTAARVVNAAVDMYLHERRSRMGMVTDNRLQVLSHLADSLQGELSEATTEYREYQEAEKAFDPERLGEVERAAQLRGQVDALAVEVRALDQVLGQMAGDSVAASDILAFPSFLSSDAINNILDRIFALQTERMELLTRRTARDEEVVFLQENIEYLNGELLALARSYRTGIHRQLDEFGRELQRYREELASRPQQEERTFELENEVERLTASYLGVQAQLVQARLGSIGEGADLRQIDVAPPPKKPEFPIWWMNLGIGMVAGLILGLVMALFRGSMSSVVRDTPELRRLTGLPVGVLESEGLPFLIQQIHGSDELLILPLEGVGDTLSGLFVKEEGGEGGRRVLTSLGDPDLTAGLKENAVVVPAVRCGRTPRKAVEDTLEALQIAGAPVPGILFIPE